MVVPTTSTPSATAALAQRLAFWGDLPEETVPGKRYEGSLVAGVKAFQERHGLEADGVIGKGTLAQLAVTPAEEEWKAAKMGWPL